MAGLLTKICTSFSRFAGPCAATLVVLMLLVVPTGTSQAEEKGKAAGSASQSIRPGKLKTVKTQALGKETYLVLEAAQNLYDAKDFKGAGIKLDELKPRYDKLNDLEKATYWNFKAGIFYSLDDSKGAMEAYKNVLKQKELPELMRSNTLYAIAQLSFTSGNYAQAIRVMQKWMTLATDVKPDQHMLIAQAHYQLKQYGEAEKSTLAALKVAKTRQIDVKESWLALLRASYYELKNYPRTTKVLENLAQRWPKTSYWMQLAGLYGLMEQQDRQLSVLRANYEAGSLKSEGDLLNLARLYILNETPFAAVQVLQKSLKQGLVKESIVTLQLYAQALSLSKEHDDEITTLGKLAALSGEAKHYVYLGQAHVQLGHWAEAADAYRRAAKSNNVERPGSLQMMIGNALYNQKKITEAKAAFQAALQYSDTVKDAATWVNFMDKELQRMADLDQPNS